MNKNIDEILQLTTEEFVIKGCTKGLKTRYYNKYGELLLPIINDLPINK